MEDDPPPLASHDRRRSDFDPRAFGIHQVESRAEGESEQSEAAIALKRILLILALPVLATLHTAPAQALPLPGFRPATGSKAGLLPVRWLPTTGTSAKRPLLADATKQKSPAPVAGANKTGPKPSTGASALGAVRLGGTCSEDEQCVEGTYCAESSNRCTKLLRAVNVLYLFYWSGDRRFTEVLGLFWRHTGRRGYNVLFPLYWHFYKEPEQRTARVVFPFYWSFEDKKAQTRNVLLLPFQYRRAPGEKNYRLWPLIFWTDYGKAGAGLTVLPLFHRSRRGTHTSTWAPLLLSGYASDPARHYSRGLILGLYYWNREGQPGSKERKRADAVFPFFYHSSGHDKSFTWALPLTFYSRWGQERRLTIFPLLYYRGGPKAATTVSLIPPFYYRRDGGNTRLLSPLFLYEKDRDAKVSHWGLIVPPYYHRRDDERSVDTLIPIIWRWRNHVEESTTWVVGPFITRSDPTGGTQILLPIFWRFSDAKTGASTSVLFPFAYRHRRKDGSHFNLFFPFYYGGRRPDGSGSWSAGLLPLLYFGAGEGKRHAVLFPLFWHFRNAKTSTTVLGTAYYRRESDGWMAGLAPLLFAGRRGGDSHQVLFPIFWHLRSKVDNFDTWVAGPFFHASASLGRLTGIVPLFVTGHWRGTHYTAVVPPLFYHKSNAKTGESITLATLYWGYRKRREVGHHLLPIAFYRKRWNDKGETTRLSAGVLPLFYYRRSPQKSLLLTPVGGYRRDEQAGLRQGLLGPVFWHRSKTQSAFAVAPLFLRHTDHEAKATTTILLPLGVHYTSPKQRSLVVFPIFWRFDYQRERNLVVFPFYWRTREDDAKGTAKNVAGADVLFPLYWRFFSPERRTTVAGPAFWYRSAKTAGWGLLPLAIYRRNEKKSWAFALPFVWYGHDFATKQRTWVVGPYYFRRYDKGYATGLLPLLYHKRTPERRYTLLFPLVWYFAKPKEQTSLLIAGPYFSHSSDKRRGLGVFPLFYTAIDRAGERDIALFPLFYHISSPLRSALYTPIFGYDRTPERRHFYVGPYFHQRGTKRDIDTVVPIFWRSYHHESKTTTVLALPGYFGSWRRGHSVHVAFPLFWQWKGVDWANTVLFPFFWDFNDRHSRRTTVVMPLFARDRDAMQHTVSWYTLPSVWVRQRPKATDVVVFPLFWHYGGERKSSTVGFPLYWDFKSERKRSTVLFPLFWRFDRPDHRTYVVANSYYYRNKRKQTYDFWFIPFVRVQRKRPQDINVEVLLNMFGYERVGRNRFLSFFWIPIKLEPTPGRAAPPSPAPASKPQARRDLPTAVRRAAAL